MQTGVRPDDISAPAVTVVIPAWGAYAEGPLREAVASVHAQNVVARVLVVDNASELPVTPPAGAELVRSEQRLTRGAARNLGLAHVRSPLVMFLDADDVLLPGALATLTAGFDAGDAHGTTAAVIGGIVDAETGDRHRVPRRLAAMLAGRPAGLAASNAVWSLVPLQGCAILRTELVRAAGGYGDREHGEDWVLAASLAWRGRIRFTDENVLVYAWRDDSLGRLSPTPVLIGNARAVRERMRADDHVPAWLHPAALWLTQRAAIHLIRPLARRARRAR